MGGYRQKPVAVIMKARRPEMTRLSAIPRTPDLDTSAISIGGIRKVWNRSLVAVKKVKARQKA